VKKTHLLVDISLMLGFCLLLSNGCKVDDPLVNISSSGYPSEIGKIVLTKCATSGCHNEQSKAAAAGLSMATWEALFQGGRNGACVIPYRADYSLCMYYINTFSDLGPSLLPHMPYNLPALSRAEVLQMQAWILAGAPDNQGHVKFADNPLRHKLYITNQGCDEVAVVDGATKLIMRYIHVGNSSQIQSPHMVRVSPDGNYWYVVFINGNSIQKYRTSDDSYVGEVNIGSGSWNTFAITSDSKKAFVSDWNSPGKIQYVDLSALSLLSTYQSASPGFIDWPHGTAVNQNATTLYAGNNVDKIIYKIDISDPIHPPSFNNITIGPVIQKAHDIVLSPDGKKYFVTCTQTNEVRILNVSNDSVIAVIHTGNYPQEMALSLSTPYAFVTCQEDTALFPGSTKRGAVTVFNYQTNTFVANIDANTYQPHGVAVDDKNGLVYIASRNINPNGPAPHHTSTCAGRDGYLSTIDLNTLQYIKSYRPEMTVDPYSIAVRP
jgi:YVTN family beta-propeller protein